MWLAQYILKALSLVLPSVQDIFPKAFGNAAAREAAAAQEDVAAKEAYSKEWSYNVANRSGFDVFMDGVNRLPRPLFSLGIVGLFVWCCIDPPAFSRAMVALALVPEPLWNVMFVVIAFFFSGRMLDKVSWGKYSVPKGTVEMAKKNAEPQEFASFGALDNDELMILSRGGSRERGWTNPIADKYEVVAA